MDVEVDEAEEKRKDEEGKSRDSIKPPADIQAILTVLGRRTLEHERGEDRKLDLHQTDLGGVDIKSGFLGKADLMDANLQEAHLRDVNLQGADLIRANLQEADLMDANLQEAYLGSANLQKVSLWRANLQEAILEEANLQGARKLTVEQLSKVKTLYKAKLDPELMEQIEEKYPHLLEVPKPE